MKKTTFPRPMLKSTKKTSLFKVLSFNYGHWLPCTLAAVFSVEGCFGASKQDKHFFLSFHQSKTGQLDRQ
jgi:hypothetical protein